MVAFFLELQTLGTAITTHEQLAIKKYTPLVKANGIIRNRQLGSLWCCLSVFLKRFYSLTCRKKKVFILYKLVLEFFVLFLCSVKNIVATVY